MRMSKSRMAANIQDGGQQFCVPSTRIFSLANIYHHAKFRLVPKCVTHADRSSGTVLPFFIRCSFGVNDRLPHWTFHTHCSAGWSISDDDRPHWIHDVSPRMDSVIAQQRDLIEVLVQDCSNSSALAMELLQSCTKPSKCSALLYIALQIQMKMCSQYFELTKYAHNICVYQLWVVYWCCRHMA